MAQLALVYVVVAVQDAANTVSGALRLVLLLIIAVVVSLRSSRHDWAIAVL